MDMGMISKVLGTMAPSLADNPNARAMIQAVQSGDAEAGERIARNLCQSYGVTPEQAIQQAKGFFHIQ